MTLQLGTVIRVAVAFAAALIVGLPSLVRAQEACRAGYYTQCTTAAGVPVAAPPEVSSKAVDAAVATVEMMLAYRPDIAERLAARGAALLIIPKDQPMTVLPEFAHLAGQFTSDGRPYDGPSIRGLGGSVSQPASSSGEENLLRIFPDVFGQEDITIHEFGHAIMNIGFTAQESARWRQIARAEMNQEPFAGRYASVEEYEFWAELSQAWFRASSEWNAGVTSPEQIAGVAPQAYAFLTEIYGEPGPGMPRVPSYDDPFLDPNYDPFMDPSRIQPQPQQ